METTGEEVGFEVEGSIEGAVDEALGGHGFAAKSLVGEEVAMPNKHGVALELEVVGNIDERVDVVLAAAGHLLLALAQEIDDGGVVGELGVDWECFDRHADGMEEAFVGAAVIDSSEEGFLATGIFGEEESVDRGEEIAFENAVILQESVEAVGVERKGAEQMGLGLLRAVEVGKKRGVGVGTVELGSVPTLGLLEGGRLAKGCLGSGDIGHCENLGFEGLTFVSLVDIGKNGFERGAVVDDMMYVDEEIEMLAVAKEANVKQSVANDFERNDKLRFDRLDIGDLLHLERECLVVLNGLQGLALTIQLDTCEQRGMGSHSGFDGFAEACCIEGAIEDIKIRSIIAGLILLPYTFGIDAVLHF